MIVEFKRNERGKIDSKKPDLVSKSIHLEEKLSTALFRGSGPPLYTLGKLGGGAFCASERGGERASLAGLHN